MCRERELKKRDGTPQASGNGTSTTCPSDATNASTSAPASASAARASRSSGLASLAYRAETCVSASRRAPARAASSPASVAVAWPVERARPRSSSANVASWTSRSAPSAAATVRVLARRLDGTRRPCVARVNHPTPRSGRPDDLLRADRSPVLEGHRLAGVETAVGGPRRDLQLLFGFLAVEPPGPVVLDQRVADRDGAVFGAKGPNLVAVGGECDAPRAHLVHPNREVGVVAGGVDEVVEPRSRPRGTVDRERPRALVEPEGLDQPRDPEDVVSVEVRDEDVVEAEPGVVAHHLALSTLAAVEQKLVALPRDVEGAGRALDGGDGPPGPEEGDAKRHSSALGSAWV